jgi:hypothetical protein
MIMFISRFVSGVFRSFVMFSEFTGEDEEDEELDGLCSATIQGDATFSGVIPGVELTTVFVEGVVSGEATTLEVGGRVPEDDVGDDVTGAEG